MVRASDLKIAVNNDNYTSNFCVNGSDDTIILNIGSSLGSNTAVGIGLGHIVSPKGGIFFERQSSYSRGRLKFCVDNTADSSVVTDDDMAIAINMDRTVEFVEDIYVGATKKLYLDGGSNTYITEGAGDRMDFYTGGNLRLQINAGSVEVASGYDLRVNASDKIYLDGGGNTYIHESTADTMQLVTAGTATYTQTSTGIGIHDTTPDFELSVHGTTPEIRMEETGSGGSKRFSIEVEAGGVVNLAAPQSAQTIEISTVGTNAITIDANQNMAFGGYFSIPAGDKIYLDGGGNTYLNETSGDLVKFTVGGTDIVWIASDGFYLGASNGDNQFRTSSAGSGSTTMYIGNESITTSSDRRLKTNIVDSSLDAVDVLNQLRVTEFDWDDPSDTSFNNRNARGTWTGLIAQEVVEHLPFAVNAPRDEDKVIDYDSDSTWSITPLAMCGVLVKAVQELSTRIEALEAQLDG